MGANQILEKMDKNRITLQLGNEVIVVGLKNSKVRKGIPTNELIEELRKASKENLLIPKHEQLS